MQGTTVTLASIQAQLENLRAATREHEAKANIRVVTLDTLEDIDNRIVKAVALLDSGATHAVIPFRDSLTNLEKVPVTLAGDAKQEWMRTAGGTLVVPPAPGGGSGEPTLQTILPLGALVESLGCSVSWM